MQKALAIIAACQVYQVITPPAVAELGPMGSMVGWFAFGAVVTWLWKVKDERKPT